MSFPRWPSKRLLPIICACAIACGAGCGGDDGDAGDEAADVDPLANNGVDDGRNNTIASSDAGWSSGQNNTTNNATLADAGGDDPATNNGAVVEPPDEDCAIVVAPRESAVETSTALQEAFLDVQPGQVVCLVDGTYALDAELSVDVADVEIRGQSQEGTILDFAPQSYGANGVLATSDGFTLTSLTIRDTAGDGVRTTGVQGVTFRDLTVEWSEETRATNGARGLYPVQSQDVLIEGCEVSGAGGAGIHVSQSQRVVVRDNEARGNGAGVEVENSTEVEIHHNHLHDNASGILLLNLPTPPIQGGERAKVHHNVVEHNDRESASVVDGVVARIPSGTGIVVLAADLNEIHDNELRGNDSVGIAILSYQSFEDAWENPTFDPYAEGNYVHDNLFVDNGLMPAGLLLSVAGQAGVSRLEAMLWDGYVDPAKSEALDGPLANCFADNVDQYGEPAGFRMMNAPLGFADQSTGLGDNACSGTELPAITLPQDE